MKHLDADNDARGTYHINLSNKCNICRDIPVLCK